MDHWRCFLANTSGWYYSIEGNRALKDKKKGQWNQFYFQEKNIKTKSQRISNNLKQSQTISKNHKQSQTISNNLKKSQKKTQKISKYLKISQFFLNVVFQTLFLRDWVLYCIFFWTTENLKKSQKNSKSFRFAGKRRKKTIKNKIRPNKLMQTYKNLGPSLRFLPCFLKQ